MAASKLQLQVILSALDKATAPLKRIQGGSIGAAKALKETRDSLKALNTQQRDVSAYRIASIELAKQNRAQTSLKDKLSRTTEQLESTRTAHEKNTAAQKAARSQYNKLSQALINGKGNTAEFRLELEKARVRLDATTAAFTHTQKMVKTYKDRVRYAGTELERLNSKQKSTQDSLAGLKTKLDAAGIGTDGLGNKARKLRNDEKLLNATLKQQEERLKRVTEQQKRLAAAKSQYQKAQGLAGSMAGSGAAGLATGSGMLYAGARLMAPGVEYGAQMSELQAVTRLDKGDDRFAMLKQQARDLGASTAFSATDVGAGQTFLARAGFTPEAINASMQDVLNLALANGVDLARTADIASNISSAFKIDPEVGGNITRVTDVLSGAAARANVDLEMLGDTMKYMGSAEGLGLSLEQAATMAGLLGNIGIQGSQAGTTMRAMLNRLAAPAKSAQDSIESLGLKVGDASGNMRALPDILQDVATATAKMGNIERAAHLKNIFGEEAGSGMAELIAKQGTGALTDLLGELQNVAGENAKMAATRADNIDGDLKGLRSAWEEVGIGITDVNEGPLRELIQSFTGVIRGVGEWIKANPALAAGIVKTAAGLGMLIAAGGAIALTLSSILGPIAMVRYAITLLSIATTAASWPVLAIIGAIAALAAAAYLIYANWEPIKAFFSQTWGQITMDTLNFLGRVSKIFLDWNPLGLLYTVFADVLSWFGIDIPRKFTDAGVAIVQGLISGFTSMFPAAAAAIGELAESMKTKFKSLLGIHSPSRVFASLGVDTMDGLAQGLNNGSANPFAALDDTAKQVIQKGGEISANNPFAGLAGMPELANTEQLTFDKRPPISAASNSAPAGAAPITINVYAAAGQDANAIAQAVAREFAKQQNAQQAKQRGRLSDLE